MGNLHVMLRELEKSADQGESDGEGDSTSENGAMASGGAMPGGSDGAPAAPAPLSTIATSASMGFGSGLSQIVAATTGAMAEGAGSASGGGAAPAAPALYRQVRVSVVV